MQKVVLSSLLMLAVSSVHAAEGPRWDSVSLTHQTVDVEGDKLKGFGFGGTKELAPNAFITGSYASASDSYYGIKVEYNTLSAGFGYKKALSATTDFYGVISYEDVEFKASYLSSSDTGNESGYGLAAGLRSMLTDKFELYGGLKFVDIGEESETALSVGGLYNFTEKFSAGLGLTKTDDADTLAINAVYYF